MKSLENLQEKDYIAFGFNYDNKEPSEIIVSNITKIYKNKVLTHFLYGHKSLSEYIKKQDILAIGNPRGEGKIKGWTGNYDILKPERIKEILKENT
ncbi:MAG TPA: hypothetical protein VJ912_03740 [Candidatus Nanoarchaeia archaeon]|nr:hypothetical protein [Candidatus Nanoarchaeia archaeon]